MGKSSSEDTHSLESITASDNTLHNEICKGISPKQGTPGEKCVFGNKLENLTLYKDSGGLDHSVEHSKEKELPEFIVRCIKQIEQRISSEGIYRINGDFEKVEAMR